MPVWFEVGVPQSWAFVQRTKRDLHGKTSQLTVLNQPNPAKTNPSLGPAQSASGSNLLNGSNIDDSNRCINNDDELNDCGPRITQNRSIALPYPGRPIQFSWGNVNETVGPSNSYDTSQSPLADEPRYATFVSQLNATYVPLVDISGTTRAAIQPHISTSIGDPAVNRTIVVAITSQNPYATPFNLSMVNPFVYAGPALYQAG